MRHAPWEYELELNEEGWVDISQLLYSLREKRIWKDVNEEVLKHMIMSSDKKRYEIIDGRIRALYGHSTPHRIIKDAKCPPAVLYHGTAARYVDRIKRKGLLPQKASDVETAKQVGKRRDTNPTLLCIKAVEAWNEGVRFYKGNDSVWLAHSIPSKFIDF
ncbi:RNA 2'-phosphotransferase [Caldalkalibacillus salinus]|uniref:RNA 2'-phosphotransferase n=1 Tax=Caldalkalibacillus salinus TaxID=2803787 RepID=UPI00301810E0